MAPKRKKKDPKIIRARKMQEEIWSLQKRLDRLLLSMTKRDIVSSNSDLRALPFITKSGLQEIYRVSFTSAETLCTKLILLQVIQCRAGGGFELADTRSKAGEDANPKP